MSLQMRMPVDGTFEVVLKATRTCIPSSPCDVEEDRVQFDGRGDHTTDCCVRCCDSWDYLSKTFSAFDVNSDWDAS